MIAFNKHVRNLQNNEMRVRQVSKVFLTMPHAYTTTYYASFSCISIPGSAQPQVPKVLEFYVTKLNMQTKINREF